LPFSPGSLGSDAKAERTAREFADLVASAVNGTVSPAPIKFLRTEREDFEGFVAHVVGKAPAPMRLRNGHFLFVYHRLGLRRAARYLTTLEYAYWYQADESEHSWIFRYEYQREPVLPYRYPRSHIHINATPATYRGAKAFPELHLPAGTRVTIESVLRHLIEEHDVPPLSPAWSQTLDRTEADFKAIQDKRALEPDDPN
jgi:hypothetical protein